MAKHEAVFIEAECSQYNQKFYLRYDYAADDVWVQTYGVKEKERFSSCIRPKSKH